MVVVLNIKLKERKENELIELGKEPGGEEHTGNREEGGKERKKETIRKQQMRGSRKGSGTEVGGRELF